MITEAPAPPSTLSETVEQLRSDLDNIQRELDQVLEVWRSTLINEKKEAQALFQNQRQIWNQEDQQWQEQRQAYEQKIQDLQKTFADQMALTEQNALRALNELDDSWQRDKLQWQQDSSRRIKELESRESQGAAERQKQESLIQELKDQAAQLEAQAQNQAQNREMEFNKYRQSWEQTQELHDLRIQEQDRTIHELQDRLAELDTRSRVQETDWSEKQVAWNRLRESYEERICELEASLVTAAQQPPVLDVAMIEELKASWDREKAVWQQSLYDNILQLNEREAQWNEEREKQDRFLHKLQEQVVALQSLLAASESRQILAKNFVDNTLQSLESEVAVLHEMITHLFAPRPQPALVGHPMRRKTDLPYAFR